MSSLWFDDNGRKIEILDFVLVNENVITQVDEDRDGERYLKGMRGVYIETIIRSEDLAEE